MISTLSIIFLNTMGNIPSWFIYPINFLSYVLPKNMLKLFFYTILLFYCVLNWKWVGFSEWLLRCVYVISIIVAYTGKNDWFSYKEMHLIKHLFVFNFYIASFAYWLYANDNGNNNFTIIVILFFLNNFGAYIHVKEIGHPHSIESTLSFVLFIMNQYIIENIDSKITMEAFLIQVFLFTNAICWMKTRDIKQHEDRLDAFNIDNSVICGFWGTFVSGVFYFHNIIPVIYAPFAISLTFIGFKYILKMWNFLEMIYKHNFINSLTK